MTFETADRQETRFAILLDVPGRLSRRGRRMADEIELTEPDEEIAAAYHAHYGVLEYLATQRFRIPRDDVRCVIHDVFVAFIRNRRKIQTNARSWLVGAMCIQCRLYWRTRGRDDVLRSLDDDLSVCARVDDIATRVDASAMLRRLPRRCRELLQLRFYEECSSAEIARRYATTVDYARKLLHQCVSNARALFGHRRSRS